MLLLHQVDHLHSVVDERKNTPSREKNERNELEMLLITIHALTMLQYN